MQRKPLRATHIITGTGIGGAERMLQKLILATEGQTLRNEVISLVGLGAVGEELLEAGIPVHALKLRGLASIPSTVRAIRSRLHESNAQVVPTWMYHADFIGGWAARAYPVLWGIRHAGLEGGSLKGSTRIIAKLCAWSSKRIPQLILSNSQSGLRNHARFGYDETRMRLTPNGFDLERFCPRPEQGEALRAQIQVDAKAELIGTLSRHDSAKDLPTACQAMAAVLRARPQAHALYFGAGLTADDQRFQNLVATHLNEFRDRVHGLGPQANIEFPLAGLDAFYLSSRSEAFPNSLGEAMAVGLPCVATDVGDCRLISAGHAKIVPAEDPAALAGAVQECLQQPQSERAAQGCASRTHIAQHYSLEVSIARFVEYYHEAVARAASSKDR